jgi:hypothetical protein
MMKIYKMVKEGGQTTCTVDGQPLTMKRRSNEPPHWIGADHLALSILFDAVSPEAALLLASEFQEVIDRLPPESEITSELMQEWTDHKCALGYLVQT